MINGRVNESKESDFMKMKKILVSMFLLFLVLCLKSNVSNAAETDALNRWDLTKEYTVEQNSIRYHAYLSKDKKESWIFTADLLDKKKMLDIIIPQKIENAPVVRLGYSADLYQGEEAAWPQNLFGVTMFDYCDADSRPTLEILNVKSVVMPDAIREMGSCTFGAMGNLKYIHLSDKLTSLKNGTFFGSKDIKKIDFSAKFKVEAANVFGYCDGLPGLAHENKYLKNDTLTFSGNMVINQTEKTLIQVMPDAKKITIPKSVKWIEPTAFKNTSIKTVKVSKKNKYFAVHKRCLYRKAEKELVYVFGKGSTLTLSKKIKEISEDVVVTKAKLKKLIISHKVKRYNNWKKPFVKNNKKIKIYYRGKRVK